MTEHVRVQEEATKLDEAVQSMRATLTNFYAKDWHPAYFQNDRRRCEEARSAARKECAQKVAAALQIAGREKTQWVLDSVKEAIRSGYHSHYPPCPASVIENSYDALLPRIIRELVPEKKAQDPIQEIQGGARKELGL